MTPEKEALDYFRKLVSFLYREVGAMERDNHPELFDRSAMATSGFSAARKSEAKKIYRTTISEVSPERIVTPYGARTGLSLEDVFKVFHEGDWLLGRKRYSFGGPNWARIAGTTLALQDVILKKEWHQVPQLIAEINVLCHNNGRIVDKFAELGT